MKVMDVRGIPSMMGRVDVSVTSREVAIGRILLTCRQCGWLHCFMTPFLMGSPSMVLMWKGLCRLMSEMRSSSAVIQSVMSADPESIMAARTWVVFQCGDLNVNNERRNWNTESSCMVSGDDGAGAGMIEEDFLGWQSRNRLSTWTVRLIIQGGGIISTCQFSKNIHVQSLLKHSFESQLVLMHFPPLYDLLQTRSWDVLLPLFLWEYGQRCARTVQGNVDTRKQAHHHSPILPSPSPVLCQTTGQSWQQYFPGQTWYLVKWRKVGTGGGIPQKGAVDVRMCVSC